MNSRLQLTGEEQAMLAGEAGPGVQKAMEIVVALGQIYGAADLVPVAMVQVSGVISPTTAIRRLASSHVHSLLW